MTIPDPFLSFESSCEQALQITNARLSLAGYSTVQTFNLSSARLGSHNCSCPNHGTDECDCQMVVLLVYGKAEEPATLILHGNNGQTWLSMAGSLRQDFNSSLSAEIRQALGKVTVSVSGSE